MIIADIFIWQATFNDRPVDYVKVVFLDVGQGDAIYIESPNHNQILIDGGPNNKLLAALRTVMPFYDKSLDAIVVTNPDADHYSGFIDLLDSYSVGYEFEPGTKSETDRYEELGNKLKENNVKQIIAQSGMKIILGGGAELEILYPDRDVTDYKINDGSIVARLSYGSSTVMLMGDAPKSVEKYLLAKGVNLDSDILKVGHHGSKTSTGEEFLKAVSPDFAIISAGCKNKYGHPNKETLDILAKEKVEVLSTCKSGNIVFKLDGTKLVQPF